MLPASVSANITTIPGPATIPMRRQLKDGDGKKISGLFIKTIPEYEAGPQDQVIEKTPQQIHGARALTHVN
jgi:hypothetical protein